MNTGPAAKNFANWMNRRRMVNGDYKLAKTRARSETETRTTKKRQRFGSCACVRCCCCCGTMLCALCAVLYSYTQPRTMSYQIYDARVFFFRMRGFACVVVCRLVFVCVRSVASNTDGGTKWRAHTHTGGRTIETKEMRRRALESARKIKSKRIKLTLFLVDTAPLIRILRAAFFS